MGKSSEKGKKEKELESKEPKNNRDSEGAESGKKTRHRIVEAGTTAKTFIKEHGGGIARTTGKVVGLGVEVGAGFADAACPGAGAGIGAIAGAVQIVCGIGVAIVEQVQQAHVNKAQSNHLAESVTIICNSVRNLDPESNPQTKVNEQNAPNFYAGLKRLEQTLSEAKILVDKFCGRHWFTRVVMAKVDNQSFSDIHAALGEHANYLQLGLSAETLIQLQQSTQCFKADLADIEKIQQQILSLAREHQETLLRHVDEERVRHRVIEEHMRSFISRLNSIIAGQNELRRLQMEKITGLTTSPGLQQLLNSALVIPFSDIYFIKSLGIGRFGEVYLTSYLDTLMVMKRTHLPQDNDRLEFLREIQIVSRLHHPNIARILHIGLEKDITFYLMEYAANGTLREYLSKNILTLQQKLTIALQVAQALAYIHSQTIFHRHLTLESILITESGDALIADFALAKTQRASIKSFSGKPAKTIPAGWRAPEHLTAGLYNERSEIFCFGIFLWALLTEQDPFNSQDDKTVDDKLCKGEREDIPSIYPSILRDIITQCWQSNADQRPSLHRIIQSLTELIPEQAKPTLSTAVHPGRTAEQLFDDGNNYRQRSAFQEAAACYWLASKKGNLSSATSLGSLYASGLAGLTFEREDRVKMGITTLQAPVRASSGRALYSLALCYRDGSGIECDKELYMENLRRAAAIGYKKAMELYRREMDQATTKTESPKSVTLKKH